MRIGFDASACNPPHPTGLRRTATALLAALEERGELDVVRLTPPRGAGLRLWRQLELPRAIHREGLVGLHSFVSSFPLRGPGLRVQTIHELPWRHGVRENADLVHRLWARLGPLRADRVVCPSAFVAADVGRPRRVRVVPWGVEAHFQPEPPPGEVDEVLLERYRLGSDPLVLCPGAVRAKKNLAGVLRAVARLKRQGRRVEVVVTGPETQELRRDLGLASRLGLAGQVTTLGEVPGEDLPALYRLASVVPSLSPSEGFSLPVLEALASGTPVVVPRASAQAEVAGDGGQCVDPDDVDDVARALEDALERREELRWSLPAHAVGRSWHDTAAVLETVWKELA